jgi:anaerobic selenocysteine-containing dehydrogenase
METTAGLPHPTQCSSSLSPDRAKSRCTPEGEGLRLGPPALIAASVAALSPPRPASAQSKIAGDPDHPANRGKLCSKGTHLGETIGLEAACYIP